MTDLKQLERALVNADAAGDVQAAKVLATEIIKVRGGATTVTMTDRVVKGMRDPIDGGAQLLTKMLPEGVVQAGNAANNWIADKTGLVGRLPEGGVDQQVRESEAAYQAGRGPDAGFDGARLVGNMISPVSLATMGVGGIAAPAASLTSRVATGAAMGGVSSALNPVTTEGDFGKEKLKQVGVGTVLGGVAPAVVSGAARMVSPKASTNPNVALLKDAGVTPTVGQALGGRANAMEEKAMSIPIVGDAIANARGRAQEQFNNAAINRALTPIGEKVEGTGQAAITKAGDKLSDAYDDALNSIKSIQFDPQFQQDTRQLIGMSQSLVGPLKGKFKTKLDEVVGGRLSPQGVMLPETFKKVDSELGGLASQYRSSSVASERELGDAFAQMQALLKQQMVRSNPNVAGRLAQIDEGWANLVRVEGAGKAGKNAEGVFTPAQLNTAIQTADKSVRKRAVARGDALMQDLGSAGQQVLGNKVGNSFTADRALLAGGGLGSYFIDPSIPAALLGGAAMYTRPMQNLLSGLVTSRPQAAQPVANALRQFSPGFGVLGGQVAPQLLDR